MPTLTRIVLWVAGLAGLVYAAMLAIVTFIEPERHTVTIEIALPEHILASPKGDAAPGADGDAAGPAEPEAPVGTSGQ